jgi:hypothetical protein
MRTMLYKAMAVRGIWNHVLFNFHVSEGRHVTLCSLFKGQRKPSLVQMRADWHYVRNILQFVY